jgi:hypothetical protein
MNFFFKKIINFCTIFFTNFENFLSKRKQVNTFKSYNKKYFTQEINYENKEILVEFNAFTSNHIILANFANFYRKKFNAKIIAFFNYSLVSSPINFDLKRNIKWFLGSLLSFNFFSVYKSFNVKNFIRPKFNKELKNISLDYFRELSTRIKSKEDVLKIKIDDIFVGDLILDGYLYYNKVPTIDFKSKSFQKYLYESILLFNFWKAYFKKNNVICVIGVVATYAYGIIIRIAISNNIDVIANHGGKVQRLSKKDPYANSEFRYFKEIFKKMDKLDQIKAIELADEFIKKRFEGRVGIEINEPRITTSSYSMPYNKNINVLNKTEKLKVIIFPHELNDCSNGQGLNFFPTYYDWLETIVKISKETDYEWYAKNHPKFKGKFEKYQPYTYKITEEIFSQNSKIKILPQNTSHHQIIGEKINFGLTVNGDVAFEYAYFGIPILTATNNCDTSNYNFNIHSSSKENYINKIKNLDKIKIEINKKEILECYFMMNFYSNEISFLNNYFEFLRSDKKNLYYDSYFTKKIYYELLKNWTDEKQLNIEMTIKKFINSQDYFLSYKHCNIEFNQLISFFKSHYTYKNNIL